MGVMLYAMAAGKYPFTDEGQPANAQRTGERLLAGEVNPLPPGVSGGCADLIRSLLQRSPRMRCTVEEIIGNEWLASAAGQYARWLRDRGGLRLAQSPERWVDLRPYRAMADQVLAHGRVPAQGAVPRGSIQSRRNEDRIGQVEGEGRGGATGADAEADADPGAQDERAERVVRG